ncbi:putative motility protein [Tepidimonas sp.]|uniref:putative motility protein n=1 Tax=Tepidimonas sp. TaxID=2002775 RepID=UPI00391CEFFF
MTSTPSPVTQAAVAASEAPGAAQILVLRKALQLEQQGALALLNALPQPVPVGNLPLATSGSLGTQVNVMA